MHRRSLLKLGLVSAAVLAVAGGGLALMQPGFANAKLSAGAQEIFTALGRGILADSLPSLASERQSALAALVQRVQSLTQSLPPHAQDELSQLLALLSSPIGRQTLGGLTTPWADADVEQIQTALQSMRLSTLALRRQAYAALHDITSAAYFSEPSTWPLLGYPGPLQI